MATLDVPLLCLPGDRLPFDYGGPVAFDPVRPLDTLALLASTQTGFTLPAVPDYLDFPAPLADISRLCSDAGGVYAQEDEQRFRTWLRHEIDVFMARVGGPAELVRLAHLLPIPRQEALLVPLVLLNHLWRQGSPTLDVASGSSPLPGGFDVLLAALAESTGTPHRFNQIMMTMRVWRLDGVAAGAPVSYRDLADPERVFPQFALNGVSEAELHFYRAFFAPESLGVPAYGWGCLLLECLKADDVDLGALALRCVHDALRNVHFCIRRLIPQIDAAGFRKIQVTAGWVNDDDNGYAAGYQLPFTRMMDALFHVEFSHPQAFAAMSGSLRFVPPRWTEFFRSIRELSTGLRPWVLGSGHPQLIDAYQRCIEMFTAYRTLRRHLAGQVLSGATTTGRVFPSTTENYRAFMTEMAALVSDTAKLGVSPDSDRNP
ncbi:hypothetical protein [Streptomyces sp. NPDC047061]|uniref:hypothetical protein n=1 Tax=Streptomyces sp. NPDC047061 TaxID=3154605 RepID=UPI0033C908B5